MKSLGEFIVEKQAEYPHARGNLSGILAAIRLAAKVINRDINRAGLVHEILGDAGAENVQGEQQKKLDVFAHKTISAAFFARDDVAGFASEEEENFIAFDSEKNRNAKYIVLTDPLDGSSNIDVNVSVGTIFSIYRRGAPVGQTVGRHQGTAGRSGHEHLPERCSGARPAAPAGGGQPRSGRAVRQGDRAARPDQPGAPVLPGGRVEGGSSRMTFHGSGLAA